MYHVPDSEMDDMCKHPLSEEVTWHNQTDPDTSAWALVPSGLKSDSWARTCPVGRPGWFVCNGVFDLWCAVFVCGVCVCVRVCVCVCMCV